VDEDTTTQPKAVIISAHSDAGEADEGGDSSKGG